jgi:hypothetical protein
MEIVNADAAGQGLNDATPAAPVGGNAGTTLGAQRMLAVQHAASIWGAVLKSPVSIRIRTSFTALTCTSTSAVLGSTGPLAIWRDFQGAPLPGTWYPSALANAILGSDVDPSNDDITMSLNSGLGQASCLAGAPFYLGFDGGGSGVDLMSVVLHELSHGLGFLTFVDPTTGFEASAMPDVFESHIIDVPSGQAFPELSDTDRAAAEQHSRAIVLSGPKMDAAVAATLAHGAPVVSLGSLGEVLVGPSEFGPPLPSPPRVAPVVAALDAGGASTSDGCDSIANNVSGQVALVDRGSCSFVSKVSRLQSAGAVAVLIADNVAESPPGSPTGSDSSITIPSVLITQATGAALRTALASGAVTASLGSDPTRLIGADAENRGLLYAPAPVVPGSSVSHWDPLATPNLLMEPNITPNPGHSLDVTPSVMADLGWPLAAPAAAVPALGARAASLLAVAILAFAAVVRPRRRR